MIRDRLSRIAQGIDDTAGVDCAVLSQSFLLGKNVEMFWRDYAASSAKVLNSDWLSFSNWFLRIIYATSIPDKWWRPPSRTP